MPSGHHTDVTAGEMAHDDCGGERAGPGGQRPRWRHRRLGPLEETAGPDALANLRSRHREMLPQVERGPSSRTASCRAHFGRLGGRCQPSCECLLAGVSASQRQQLEQRPGAEQIEIVGIDVTVVAETLAWLAASSPAIFEPRQSALVDLMPWHQCATQNAIVALHEPHEQRHGQKNHQALMTSRQAAIPIRTVPATVPRRGVSEPRVQAVQRLTCGCSRGNPGVILRWGGLRHASFWIAGAKTRGWGWGLGAGRSRW